MPSMPFMPYNISMSRPLRVSAIVAALTLAQAFVLLSATPHVDRDGRFYQAFAEALAQGKLNLAIPGFHGAGFFAGVWHLLWPSSLSHIYFQMFCALLIPALAFIAGRSIFRDDLAGFLFAVGAMMMPFWWLISLIGYTGASYTCALLITLIGAAHRQRWTFLPWAVAILIKPFAVVLLPVVIVLMRGARKKSKKKDRLLTAQIVLAFLLPALYALTQYLQVGHLIVGVHPQFSESNILQDPRKIFLNLALALQMLFSVHNYHYPDPRGTGHDNMLHTTPLLIIFGLIAIAERKTYFKDPKFAIALLMGAIGCFVLNAVVGTMDPYYMDAGVLLLVIASLPFLVKNPIWIPLVLATFHFQWFYAALRYQDLLHLGFGPFVMPAIVDLIFAVWVITIIRNHRSRPRILRWLSL